MVSPFFFILILRYTSGLFSQLLRMLIGACQNAPGRIEGEEEELNEGGRDPAIETGNKVNNFFCSPSHLCFRQFRFASLFSPTAAVFALPLHAPSSAQRFSKCGMKIEWKVGKRRERHGFRQLLLNKKAICLEKV